MKRILSITALAMFSFMAGYTQDMIVKKDGTIIQAKVAKIGTSEVEYKKWSNQEGPMYAIAKSDILAITYQNGEKETFESASAPAPAAQQDTNVKKRSLNDYASSQQNLDAINVINNAPLNVSDKKIGKSAKLIGLQYGIANNSIIKTDELSVKFEMGRVFDKGKKDEGYSEYGQFLAKDKHWWIFYSGHPAVRISLTNNTDKVMYVDLANSFITKGQTAEPYYIPSATTTSSTSTTGGAFNLGGITGALGVGGLAGSLANATTIGGNTGSTTSNVVFSQRIVSIPPHSSISLPYKSIEEKFLAVDFYNYFYTCVPSIKKINIGEEFLYEESNSPYKLSFFMTFAYDEGISAPIISTTVLYCKKIIGLTGGRNITPKDNINFPTEVLYTFARIGRK